MVGRILQSAAAWLPRDRRRSGRPGELAAAPLAVTSPKRPTKILIASPDPGTRARLRKSLEKHGFQHVTMTRDGGEALDMAIRDQPEVVITELEMPVLDGIALAASVRAVPRLRDICIMLLRGQPTDPGQIWTARADGDIDCVMPASADHDLICERLSHLLSSGGRRRHTAASSFRVDPAHVFTR